MSLSPTLIIATFPHKTGSMFAHNFLLALSRELGAPYFSTNNRPSNQGKFARHDPETPHVFVGPRRDLTFPDQFRERAKTYPDIRNFCQVRHPLDLIVSQYFSHGWIHPDANWRDETKAVRQRLQAGELSMFDYARLEFDGQAKFAGRSILQKYASLSDTLANGTRHVFRYEQFVQDYSAWMRGVVDFLGIPEAAAILETLRPSYKKENFVSRFYSRPLEYVGDFRIGRGRHIRSGAAYEFRFFLSVDEITRLMERVEADCPEIADLYRPGHDDPSA